jgi:hypothetical protein
MSIDYDDTLRHGKSFIRYGGVPLFAGSIESPQEAAEAESRDQ